MTTVVSQFRPQIRNLAIGFVHNDYIENKENFLSAVCGESIKLIASYPSIFRPDCYELLVESIDFSSIVADSRIPFYNIEIYSDDDAIEVHWNIQQ